MRGSAEYNDMRHLDMDLDAVTSAKPNARVGGLPAPLIGVAKYWKALAAAHAENRQTPRWGEFKMTALGEAAPYVTILHKYDEQNFAFEFCGSAVSALFGQDLTGETMTFQDGTRAEVNWAARVAPVMTDGGCHLQEGVADPPYTSPIDFVALDLPLLNPDNDDIGYIVGCTVSVVKQDSNID
ncbi:MAG: PAS domain-containing protein [Rhodospirillaceae bacterium]